MTDRESLRSLREQNISRRMAWGDGAWFRDRGCASALGRAVRAWRRTMFTETRRWHEESGGKDVPYWYEERANVSMLAGALWLDRRCCMQDAWAQKRARGRRRRGYCDLYAWRPGSRDGRLYVEAKMRWPKVGTTGWLARLRSLLEPAIEDLHRLARAYREDGEQVAAVFCVPRWMSPRASRPSNGQIKRDAVTILRELTRDADGAAPDFLAWSFPPGRLVYWPKEKAWYAGVVLAGRLFPRIDRINS